MMKKNLLAAGIMAALVSGNVLADKISGGARVNMDLGELTIPCVEIDSPDDDNDGLFFDVRLKQRGKSLNFKLEYFESEKAEVCNALIEASLAADDDTSDVNGDSDSEDDLEDDSEDDSDDDSDDDSSDDSDDDSDDDSIGK